MKERVIFVCSAFVLLFMCLNAKAQNCEVLNQYVDSIYTKEEIHTLEKRICKLLKKQKAVPDDNRINIYYIPDYDIPDYCIVPPDSIQEYYLLGKPGVRVNRQDFLAGNFLKRLSRPKTTGRNKINGTTYIDADVIVTNSSDSLIACGNAHYLYITACYNKDFYDGKRFIIKKMHELKMKKLFTIHGLWMFPVFGITDKDEIVVFMYDKGEKIYTLNEFVDLYSKNKSYNYFSDVVYKDMKKELDQKELEELSFLRDWNWTIAEFLVKNGDEGEFFKQLFPIITEAFDKKNLRGMRMMYNDDIEMASSFSPHQLNELNRILRAKFGFDLNKAHDEFVAKINRIVQRGYLKNDDEFRLLYSRVDEIYADDSKKEEVEILEKLMGDYEESKAAKMHKKDFSK